ncbi:MAG TPA: arsenic resistance N-acetyltransferase ArsN2 [Gemmatimonadaceae bacterium]|nr:arsenic resistance N-acetyltransferase ArsN2 [Gemmatimonadaceae bacterium]
MSASMHAAATVRHATPADVRDIERLLRASELPTDGVREMIGTAPHEFVVAVHESDIVGVAGLEVCCDDALLRSVAVDAQWRSAGVGRQLVQSLVSDAESRGIRAMYLLTMTAEHYFPKFQFERIDRTEVPEAIANTGEFKSVCPSTAVAMRRVCATH